MARTPAEFPTPNGNSWTDVEELPRSDARTLEERRRLKAQLHQKLVSAMDLSAIGTVSPQELKAEVRRVAEDLCQRGSNLLNRSEREVLVNEVLDETFGLGPLEPLMRDPTVSDILINGHNVVY